MGNQLFQYAALKGLCLRHGYRAVIPDLNNRMCHGQRPLLTKLNINADVYNGEPLRHKMKEGSWRAVDRRFGRLRDNTVIEGYFQIISVITRMLLKWSLHQGGNILIGRVVLWIH